MNKKTKEQVEAFFETIEGVFDFCILDYITLDDFNDCDDFDTLTEILDEEYFFNEEIMYHADAMKFLSEHDQSLQESIAFAYDYGYQIHDINSEKLASILATEMKRAEWYENRDEIDDFLTDDSE